MGKKKIQQKIKFGKQEFSLYGKGMSEKDAKRDAKIIRSQGFLCRTKKVGDKQFLYVREKKKVGMVTKLMQAHDANIESSPDPKMVNKYANFGNWICYLGGFCFVAVIVAVCILVIYLR